MSNDFFIDQELKQKFGMRPTDGIPLFEPIELGWVCFIDKHHEKLWQMRWRG